MKPSLRVPALVAGGLAVAASVLVMPGPSPSASVAAFVPPGHGPALHLGEPPATEPVAPIPGTAGSANSARSSTIRATPPAPLSKADSTCPGRELTPEQQRRAAEAYLVAFLKGDRQYDEVLDGTRPLPGVPSRAIVVPVPSAAGG